MLAGLLFAIDDADDRGGSPGAPATMVACLPFAGTSVIEHQARRLLAAGVAQIVVIGREASPALLGALHRIGRRGVAVDAVRSLAEAAERLHPLARVLVLADGLVTTDAAVALLAGGGAGDALLVVASEAAPPSLERIGGARAWAGIARLEARRVGEAARLPADYDPQSTLLRVAEQARAAHVALPLAAVEEGHGVERDAAALARRSRRMLAAMAGERHQWFDRFVTAPLARLAMPRLVAAEVPTAVVAAVAGAIGLGGLAMLWGGAPRAGIALTLVATLMAPFVVALAGLRDEDRLARGAGAAQALLPAAAVLLLGRGVGAAMADGGPPVTALALVAAAALARRAADGEHRRWWGSPPAYLLVAGLATLAGFAYAGLAAAACYATATLAGTIEAARARLASP